MEFDQVVDYVGSNNDHELFFRFLVGFGRIDYGIKCDATFVRWNGTIHWRRFAEELTDDVFANHNLGETYFALEPPSVWDQSRKEFVQLEPITNTIGLVNGLNIYRNNLFHGSKGKLLDRDYQLCVDACKNVRLIYDACRVGSETLRQIACWAADIDGRYRDSLRQ
jgi:hypothetical protein